jgi:hypothetical protein
MRFHILTPIHSAKRKYRRLRLALIQCPHNADALEQDSLLSAQCGYAIYGDPDRCSNQEATPEADDIPTQWLHHIVCINRLMSDMFTAFE